MPNAGANTFSAGAPKTGQFFCGYLYSSIWLNFGIFLALIHEVMLSEVCMPPNGVIGA